MCNKLANINGCEMVHVDSKAGITCNDQRRRDAGTSTGNPVQGTPCMKIIDENNDLYSMSQTQKKVRDAGEHGC